MWHTYLEHILQTQVHQSARLQPCLNASLICFVFFIRTGNRIPPNLNGGASCRLEIQQFYNQSSQNNVRNKRHRTKLEAKGYFS